MSELSEVERRILSELQEAGEENIAAMINTIIDPTGNADELRSMQEALSSLVRAGLVRMALSTDPTKKLVPLSGDESLAMSAKIGALLRFRTSDRHWTWGRDLKPHIVVTSAGRARADSVLEQYGYQWWRQQARR
jgi:hypothetical protein